MKVVFTEFRKGLDANDKIVAARYGRIVEEIRDDLKSHSSMPVSYAIQDRNRILTRGARSEKELLTALDTLKLEDVPSSLKRLVMSKQLQYTSLVMGNIPFAEAQKLDVGFIQELKKLANDRTPMDTT